MLRNCTFQPVCHKMRKVPQNEETLLLTLLLTGSKNMAEPPKWLTLHIVGLSKFLMTHLFLKKGVETAQMTLIVERLDEYG
jgi:hypothetical protein